MYHDCAVVHCFCGAGCPELFTSISEVHIGSYASMGLDPKAVGEAAYRLAINPTPSLRNLVMIDSQYSQLLPLMCRSAAISYACPGSCT